VFMHMLLHLQTLRSRRKTAEAFPIDAMLSVKIPKHVLLCHNYGYEIWSR